MSELVMHLLVKSLPSGNSLRIAALSVIDASVSFLLNFVAIAQDISILIAVDGSASAATSWTTSLSVCDSGFYLLIDKVVVASNDRILIGVDDIAGVSFSVSMSGESQTESSNA